MRGPITLPGDRSRKRARLGLLSSPDRRRSPPTSIPEIVRETNNDYQYEYREEMEDPTDSDEREEAGDSGPSNRIDENTSPSSGSASHDEIGHKDRGEVRKQEIPDKP